MAGQLLSVVHGIDLAWQLDVLRFVHPQTGGGGGGGGGSIAGEVEALGFGAGEGGGAAGKPPALPGTPASTVPVEPEHQHCWSGMHENPLPQSESTLHGKRYVGTHDFTVVVMHAPASTTGTGGAHFAFGGHAGSGAATVGHVVCVWAKQTIPCAQSVSLLHGPGTHSMIGVEVHCGAGHGVLGAHAMAGHAVAPVTWHANP